MVGAPAPTIEAPPEVAVETDESEEDGTLDDSSTIGPDGSEGSGDAERSDGTEEASLDGSLGWNMENLQPTLLWAGLGCLVLLGGWLFGRAWRRVPAYLLTAPVFLGVLFVTFVYLDQMLPAF
ncbi:MAG: hypothetical protein O3C27_03185 [Actinomycetota bacterium]|nr:hypothetical protein [Actinomycetota bacterium]